jgi:hypothetical protein
MRSEFQSLSVNEMYPFTFVAHEPKFKLLDSPVNVTLSHEVEDALTSVMTLIEKPELKNASLAVADPKTLNSATFQAPLRPRRSLSEAA